MSSEICNCCFRSVPKVSSQGACPKCQVISDEAWAKLGWKPREKQKAKFSMKKLMVKLLYLLASLVISYFCVTFIAGDSTWIEHYHDIGIMIPFAMMITLWYFTLPYFFEDGFQ